MDGLFWLPFGSGSVMEPIGGWTDVSGSLLVLAVSWTLLVDGRTFPAPFWFWQWETSFHVQVPRPTTFLRLIELGGQLTIASAHLPHKGRQLGELGTLLAQIQTFVHERARQHWILGGAFNATFGLTDFHHVGESTPRPDTLTDTKRFLAPASTAHCRSRSGPDGDEHVDGRKLRTRAVQKEKLDGANGRTDAHGFRHGVEDIGSKETSGARLRLVQVGSLGKFSPLFR